MSNLDFVAVVAPPPPVVTGAHLARSIIAALPAIGGPSRILPADQLALVVLIDEHHVLTVTEIMTALGLPVACASALVDRAAAANRVVRRHQGPAAPNSGAARRRFNSGKSRGSDARTDGIDARLTLVVLTPRAKQDLKRARGAKNSEPTKRRHVAGQEART